MEDVQLVISPEDTEQTLLARIPFLAGSSNMANYLSYRATGFSVKEAAQLAGVTYPTLLEWRAVNEAFVAIETSETLLDLQNNVAQDVIRLEFLRNMRVLLNKDSAVIRAANEDIETLSDREYEYFKLIRKHYTASEYLALMKALEPERHQEKLEIILHWRETARNLDAIEGNYREVPQLAESVETSR